MTRKPLLVLLEDPKSIPYTGGVLTSFTLNLLEQVPETNPEVEGYSRLRNWLPLRAQLLEFNRAKVPSATVKASALASEYLYFRGATISNWVGVVGATID